MNNIPRTFTCLVFSALLLPLALTAQSRLATTPQVPNSEFIAPVSSAISKSPDFTHWHPYAWDQDLAGADKALSWGSVNGLGYLEVGATNRRAWGWVSPEVKLDASLRKGFRFSVEVSATTDYRGNRPWVFVAWSKDRHFLRTSVVPTITLPTSAIDAPSAGRGVWREARIDIAAADIPADATQFTVALASHILPAASTATAASGDATAGALRYAMVTLEPLGGSPLAAQAAAAAPDGRPLAADPRVLSPMVTRIVDGPAGAYFTYPHSNGFWRTDKTWDEDTFVVGRHSNEDKNDTLTLIEFDPTTGLECPVGSTKDGGNLFYSITRDGTALLSTKHHSGSGNSLVLLDLTGAQPNRVLYTAPGREEISQGADILPDGSEAAFALWDWAKHEFKAMEINVATGEVTTCMTKDWIINHVHFSPYDHSWLSVCNEIGNQEIRPLDRIWAWNAKLAPNGKDVFREVSADGKPIYFTHERSMFTKLGVIVDAVTPSPGGPRGLYEIDYDGTVRVITEGKGFQHCNISHDGRWAVADVAHAEGADVIVNTELINFKTGAREVLYTGHATKHPWHAHPHISPDGKWVVLNDSGTYRAVALEIDQAKLEAFLK